MAAPKKKKPVGRRLTPIPPLDSERIRVVLDEEHEVHEDPVKIWPMSAEDALRKALNTKAPPLDELLERRRKG